MKAIDPIYGGGEEGDGFVIESLRCIFEIAAAGAIGALVMCSGMALVFGLLMLL